jgi:riboflavin synthase
MFTGIIQSVGTVESVRDFAQDRELRVHCPEVAQRLSVGASVALDGVCQTVTELDGERFGVHAIAETLRVTTLGRLRAAATLNLEAALRAGDALGGHFVQGHVDCVGEIEATERRGDSIRYRFRAPRDFAAQLVPKGSVAIDGISLTVGPEIGQTSFDVFLIPHTLENTTLGRKQIAEPVNLESDILGKYIWRYLGRGDPGGIDAEALRRTGFVAGLGVAGEE